MLFLVYNTSFDKSILTLKTCLCAIIILEKKGEKHEKEKAFKKEKALSQQMVDFDEK